MKLSFINTYLIVTVLLISVIACNPKEEIVPENPCGNYKQPSADFIMEQTTGDRNSNNTDYLWYYNPFNTKDTIVLEGIFQFRSEFTDTNVYKHTWYVGSEKFTNFKVWRDFINVVAPNTYITIHHVVKWQPNKICNPTDDGYDSASFTFQIVNRFKALYTIGKYRMVYDTVGAPSNQDSIEMEIYFSAINKPDSVITDPTTKMVSNGNIDLRVKGLYTKYSIGQIVPSNKDPLDTKRFLSNTFIISAPNYTGFLDRFFLYIDSTDKTSLNYNNFQKKYTLKGRKIN